MARYSAKQFINAIEGTGGVISDIAKNVGCTWHTAKGYIDKYPKVREAYEAERARVTDKAQSNIVDAINKRDLQMSKWWLQVKDPEFRDKQDINNSGEQIVRVVYDRSEPLPSAQDADTDQAWG